MAEEPESGIGSPTAADETPQITTPESGIRSMNKRIQTFVELKKEMLGFSTSASAIDRALDAIETRMTKIADQAERTQTALAGISSEGVSSIGGNVQFSGKATSPAQERARTDAEEAFQPQGQARAPMGGQSTLAGLALGAATGGMIGKAPSTGQVAFGAAVGVAASAAQSGMRARAQGEDAMDFLYQQTQFASGVTDPRQNVQSRDDLRQRFKAENLSMGSLGVEDYTTGMQNLRGQGLLTDDQLTQGGGGASMLAQFAPGLGTTGAAAGMADMYSASSMRQITQRTGRVYDPTQRGAESNAEIFRDLAQAGGIEDSRDLSVAMTQGSARNTAINFLSPEMQQAFMEFTQAELSGGKIQDPTDQEELRRRGISDNALGTDLERRSADYERSQELTEGQVKQGRSVDRAFAEGSKAVDDLADSLGPLPEAFGRLQTGLGEFLGFLSGTVTGRAAGATAAVGYDAFQAGGGMGAPPAPGTPGSGEGGSIVNDMARLYAGKKAVGWAGARLGLGGAAQAVGSGISSAAGAVGGIAAAAGAAVAAGASAIGASVQQGDINRQMAGASLRGVSDDTYAEDNQRGFLGREVLNQDKVQAWAQSFVSPLGRVPGLGFLNRNRDQDVDAFELLTDEEKKTILNGGVLSKRRMNELRDQHPDIFGTGDPHEGSRGRGNVKPTSGMQPAMSQAVEAMMRDNPRLKVNSGHRSSDEQAALYASGKSPVPDGSKHEAGLAVDFGPSSEYTWLKLNASRYGLEPITQSEPWHFELRGTRSSAEKQDSISREKTFIEGPPDTGTRLGAAGTTTQQPPVDNVGMSFAGGGNPGDLGGAIVPIPGSPGRLIHKNILNQVMAIRDRYKLNLGDGYATSGHKANGEHPLGLAFDATPGPGGSWDDIDQLAAWAEPEQGSPIDPFKWVGYCVPLDSQILTRGGWKTHDKVCVGDETPGFNPDSGRTEWTRVNEVVHFENQPTTRWKTRNLDLRSTPNHRWIAERHKHIASSPLVANHYEWVEETPTTEQVKYDHRLRLSAEANFGDGDIDITPQEAAIIAWLATDGCVQSRMRAGKRITEGHEHWGDGVGKATIYQAKPAGLVSVRQDLRDVPHTEDVRDRTQEETKGYRPTMPEHAFRLRVGWIREVLIRSEIDRRGWTGFVLGLSDDARAEFVRAFIGAEGSVDRDARCPNAPGTVTVTQNPGDLFDAFVTAAYLEGFRPTITDKESVRVVSLCVPHLSGTAINRGAVDDGLADVWCVVTDLGSWTMQQDGQVVLTGNSGDSNHGRGNHIHLSWKRAYLGQTAGGLPPGVASTQQVTEESAGVGGSPQASSHVGKYGSIEEADLIASLLEGGGTSGGSGRDTGGTGQAKAGAAMGVGASDPGNIPQTIIQIGQQLGATKQMILAALETGIVESGMKNVNYGDRDSLGVFQQRPPWAREEALGNTGMDADSGQRDPTGSKRLNVEWATNAFFMGGEGGQPGAFQEAKKGHKTAGQLAQDVQVSAFPTRYNQERSKAVGMAAQHGVDLSDVGDPYGKVQDVYAPSPGAQGAAQPGSITHQYGAGQAGVYQSGAGPQQSGGVGSTIIQKMTVSVKLANGSKEEVDKLFDEIQKRAHSTQVLDELTRR